MTVDNKRDTTSSLAPEHPQRKLLASLRAQDLGLIAVLAALCVFFTVQSPHFATQSNLTNILQSVSIIGTMAAVMTLVLVCGALDLSVGSIVGLTGVTAALLMANHGWSAWPAYAVALLVGLVCGLFNGLTVIRFRINPIIVTIGTLSLFRGIAFIATDGKDVAVQDGLSEWLGFERVGFLPVTVWIMAAVFLLVWWVSRFTVAGRSVYAVGANPRAARLAGLPIERVRLLIMAVSGLAAGVAGLLLCAQAGIAVPAAGTGYELQVLTAVLLGGTSLVGGEGRVTGTLLGVLIIGVINNGMTLLSVPSYYQTVASGALLLIAVGIDQVRRGKGYR